MPGFWTNFECQFGPYKTVVTPTISTSHGLDTGDLRDHDDKQLYNLSYARVWNVGVVMYPCICFSVETLCFQSQDHAC